MRYYSSPPWARKLSTGFLQIVRFTSLCVCFRCAWWPSCLPVPEAVDGRRAFWRVSVWIQSYIIVAHFSCGTCCNFSQVAVKYGFKVHCLESNFEEFHWISLTWESYHFARVERGVIVVHFQRWMSYSGPKYIGSKVILFVVHIICRGIACNFTQVAVTCGWVQRDLKSFIE